MKNLNIPDTQKTRIVIIGGGFAGLNLAQGLRKSPFQVVLVDSNNYHQFTPLVYQVATAGLEPSAISFPFRKIFQEIPDFHFRQAEVIRILPERKMILTDAGDLQYDKLVLATGTAANFFGNDNIAQNGMTLKTTTDAVNIRNTVLVHLEKAMTIDDPTERTALLNIVITGGGPTGVEMVGALSDLKRNVLPKEYPGQDFNKMNIYLIEAGDRLLNAFDAKSSEKAFNYLTKLGAKVLLNTKVENYDGFTVTLADSTELPTYNFIWAAGISGNAPEGLENQGRTRQKRIVVDTQNKLIGRENIYAIGDIAMMTGDEKYPDGHSQLCQPAMQQGKHLARNLILEAKGKHAKPFKYMNLGIMAIVGRNRAITELPFVRFYGFMAWVSWLFLHLMYILGVKNRVLVLINWMYHYFTFDQSLRLILSPTKQKKGFRK
jgi:NADH:ubiquinone reductase (H+-translocating)